MSIKQIKLFLKNRRRLSLILGILAVIVNIIFFQSTYSLALLLILAYWVIVGVFTRIDEKFFFKLALIFLVLAVPPFLLKQISVAERFSVWEFLFLILGLWQYFYLELREKFLSNS